MKLFILLMLPMAAMGDWVIMEKKYDPIMDEYYIEKVVRPTEGYVTEYTEIRPDPVYEGQFYEKERYSTDVYQ